VNKITVSLPSFAKINWNLRVLGKRPDGFHDLATIFQTVSLRDELRFVRRDDGNISLTCDDPTLPTDKKNIVVRAANALRDKFQLELGADVELVKRIPSRAGLGGASSNAAIALLGLSMLWGLETTDLGTIAARLGADVPFFLVGGRALGKGTGTVVSSLGEVDKTYLIIVSPNATVSTEFAYRALDVRTLTSINAIPILARSSAELALSDSDQWPLHNDFEAVIFDIEPEIERAKAALLHSGARGALLAGSGASVFGIFATDAARQTALDCLECEPGWRVFTCETLSRDEYFREMGESASNLLRSIEKLSGTGA
jgi:4-diphosphocytidyl-2-C-methyl-D-erythritol kinase